VLAKSDFCFRQKSGGLRVRDPRLWLYELCLSRPASGELFHDRAVSLRPGPDDLAGSVKWRLVPQFFVSIFLDAHLLFEKPVVLTDGK
jgi:hypothetical protein